MFSKKSVFIGLVISCAAVAGVVLARSGFSTGPHMSDSAVQGRNTSSFPLPQMDGNHLVAKVVQVTYPPGGSSQPHSHPCPVIGYVIAGSVHIKVDGGIDAVYKPGDTFYEAPNGVHRISANASTTEPATFLAYFVCDHETPLTVAPPKTAGAK